MQDANLIYIDELTDLYNRRYLFTYLPKELEMAESQKYNVWVLMLDLDGFKAVNDTYGHLCADELLKDIAKILKNNTKFEDKKIRYAGDEFTIVISNTDAKGIPEIAKRLVDKVSAYRYNDPRSQKEIALTVSLGIAGYPQDAAEARKLVELADKALYVSKQKGKNCFSSASEITSEMVWKKDILERFPCPVLVGRENEFTSLKNFFKLIPQTKKTDIVFISGELGSGKSRLLGEFGRFISADNSFICAQAKCAEKFTLEPYYILTDVLYGYFSKSDKLPEGLFEGFSKDELSALFSLLPGLADMAGLIQDKDKPLQDPLKLRDSLIKLLANLSLKKSPLAILLDDFQYVDEQTMELLLYLVKSAGPSAVLIVCAFSLADISQDAVFKPEAFSGCGETVKLLNLSEEGVKKMISAIFADISLTVDFYDLVYRITKGNPLFVEELLKHIVEKEYIFYQRGQWIQRDIREADLPKSVGDTIKARLEVLSPEMKDMIAKAAAIGGNFQIDLLQKIDSEDRGYVMDLVGSAKKIGLIYDVGLGGGDEFRFATDEIRKILFKVIGDGNTKRIYSRLGQAEERLNPDNLSKIAGELYYNFKKAEDWSKAEHYAKLVKEGKGVFYDRAVKYAQDVLEEANISKMLVPLSKEVFSRIPELIRSIYIAGVNSTLYPENSQIRVKSNEDAHNLLVKALSETDILNIACIDKTIIVNNKKLGKDIKNIFVDSFSSALRNLSVESVSFQKGVTVEELTKFVKLMNSGEEKEESFSKCLESSGVVNIRVNEIVYDASKKKSKEKEGLEDIMLIDYLMGRLPGKGKDADLSAAVTTRAEEIAQELERLGEQAAKAAPGVDKQALKAEIVAKSIQKVGGQLSGKDVNTGKYKEGLSKAILAMEPALRSDILANQAEDKDAGSGIIQELGGELPDEVIIDVLSRQYLKKDVGLDKMKRLAERFLFNPQKKSLLAPVLKEKLIGLGASKEECDWILGIQEREISLDAKMKKIIALPAKELVRVLPTLEVDYVVKEFLVQKDEAQVEAVMESLIRALEQKHPDNQLLAGYLKNMLDMFIKSSPDKLLPKFIYRFCKIYPQHREILPVFLAVFDPYLDRLIRIFLSAERFDLMKDLIEVYSSDQKAIEGVSGIINSIADKLIEEFVRRMDTKLDLGVLTEIVILLKDKVLGKLIDSGLFEGGVPEGKYFEAYMRRRVIARILDWMPIELVLNIFKNRFMSAKSYLMNNLIEIIAAMESEDIAEALESVLSGPDHAVRRKAIFVLGKMKSGRSARLLLKISGDKDKEAAGLALRTLKGRADEAAKLVIKAALGSNSLTQALRDGLSS